MAEYVKTFTSIEELEAEFTRMAAGGVEAAIEMSANPQVSTLEAYTTQPEQLTHFRLAHHLLERQFVEDMLDPAYLAYADDFRTRSRKREKDMNGKVVETFTLATKKNGISLQLVFIEEWWQAFGGAHVADTAYIWLIKRPPVAVPTVEGFGNIDKRKTMGRITFDEIGKDKCARCKNPIDEVTAHCVFCGFPNERFNEDRFMATFGKSLAERRQKECNIGHPSTAEMVTVDFPFQPYCGDCGKYVFNPALPNSREES